MKSSLPFSSFIITLLLLFLISTTGFSQNLLVQNAGSTPVNGIYLLDGTLNGKNKYTQDVVPPAAQHFIYWDGSIYWNIATLLNPETSLYYAVAGIGGSKTTPPYDGWIALSKTLNPPPTIIGTPLPVELVSFSAHVNGETVLLNWRTETEVNNYGFDVERSSSAPGTSWEAIGFVPGNGNSNSPKNYSFIDGELLANNIIYYRLKQIDNDGTYDYSHQIEVNLTSPDKYSLEQNYPNPFNPSTKINYKIAQNEFVKLAVYNLLGKEVTVLVDAVQSAGSYSIIFNAENLPGGVYFYMLETEHYSHTGKMLLLK